MGPSSHCLWKPPGGWPLTLDLLPPPAAGPVLDLACGSGRAVVWLAEKGYRVTGIDWQPEALDLGRRLAASRGVACRFLVGDLRRYRSRSAGALGGGPQLPLPADRDFWKRCRGCYSPGGWPWSGLSGRLRVMTGIPVPRYRLGPGELLRYFPGRQLRNPGP